MLRRTFSIRTEIVLNLFVLSMVSVLLLSIVVFKVTSTNLVNKEREENLRFLNGLMRTIDQRGNGDQSVDLLLEGAFSYFSEFAWFGVDKKIVKSSSTNFVVDLSDGLNLDDVMDGGVVKERVVKGCKGFPCLLNVQQIDYYAPLLSDGKLFGVLVVHEDFSDIRWSLAQTHKAILFFSLIFSILLLLFSYFVLSKIIVMPINHMRRVSEAISDGDENQRINLHWKDELGKLGGAINGMTERLIESKAAVSLHLQREQALNVKLKQVQSEVVAAEKLASVGRLAAGLAHEIGNPLGAVIGYLDILKSSENKEERDELIGRVERELNRIHLIIRELLGYARPKSSKLEKVDVGAVVPQTLAEAVSPKMIEEVNLHKNIEEDVFAWLDANQLKQVLLNLIINACYAMRDIKRPKQLTIDVRSVKITRTEGAGIQQASDNDQMADEGILVSICDTGTGMPADVQSKVFDAFFTTKEPGEGTGLGLYVSASIVRAWGGKLLLESTEGEGSVFSILLEKA